MSHSAELTLALAAMRTLVCEHECCYSSTFIRHGGTSLIEYTLWWTRNLTAIICHLAAELALNLTFTQAVRIVCMRAIIIAWWHYFTGSTARHRSLSNMWWQCSNWAAHRQMISWAKLVFVYYVLYSFVVSSIVYFVSVSIISCPSPAATGDKRLAHRSALDRICFSTCSEKYCWPFALWSQRVFAL